MHANVLIVTTPWKTQWIKHSVLAWARWNHFATLHCTVCFPLNSCPSDKIQDLKKQRQKKPKPILHCCFFIQTSLSVHWLYLGGATELPQSSCHVKPKQAFLCGDFFPLLYNWCYFANGCWLVGFLRCFVILSDIRTVLLKIICLRTDEKLKSLVSSNIPKEGVKKMCHGTLTCVKVSLTRQDILMDFMYYISLHR